MLIILLSNIWGHCYKDNFEEINAQVRNLWPKLHESLWSLSEKTQVPAAPTGIAVDGLTCSGLWRGWFRDNTQSLCLLPLLISTGTLPSQLTCLCLAGAWKKSCYKRALLSRQAAVKDLPVELRTWEERSPSLLSDFPAPSPGPAPAPSLAPFPPQQTATCCWALPWMIRGANILHTQQWFSLCFLLSGLK